MKFTKQTLLVLTSVVVGLLSHADGDDKQAQTHTAVKQGRQLYEGFDTDRALLRKTVTLEVKGGRTETLKASSYEACAAASRIFARVSFLFRTRAEVLELLGDPAMVSDYNKPASKERTSPLVYRLDSGLGGWQYTISFDKQGKVNQIRADGLD